MTKDATPAEAFEMGYDAGRDSYDTNPFLRCGVLRCDATIEQASEWDRGWREGRIARNHNAIKEMA
jgi:ribosome modulation factor